MIPDFVLQATTVGRYRYPASPPSRDNRYFRYLSEHVGVLGTGTVRQDCLAINF